MTTTGETTETIVVAGEGLTASLLIWRRFGKPMPGTLERLYELNPGLAALGPFLPVGRSITVPIPPPAASPTVTPVRLWG